MNRKGKEKEAITMEVKNPLSNLVLKPWSSPIPQKLPPTSIDSPTSELQSAVIPPSNMIVSMPEVQSSTDAASLAVKVKLVGATCAKQTKTTIVIDSKPDTIKKCQPSTKPMCVGAKITVQNLCAFDWQSNGHQKEPATVSASYWNELSKVNKERMNAKSRD
ncbi:hypothetical protein BD769DRAFT_1685870 [Suillus cothurnatus]|nr:hypothetical protein BD769DRAFT_1685870 [Suillus cothurnatus]